MTRTVIITCILVIMTTICLFEINGQACTDNIEECLKENPQNLTITSRTRCRGKPLLINNISEVIGEEDAQGLKYLKIEGLKVTHLTAKMFRNLKDVEFLDLSNNQIQVVSREVFNRENLPNLRHLEMNNNPLDYESRKEFQWIRSHLEKRQPTTDYIHIGSTSVTCVGIVITLSMVILLFFIRLKKKRTSPGGRSRGYEIADLVSREIAQDFKYGRHMLHQEPENSILVKI